jgi:hypothetical protein
MLKTLEELMAEAQKRFPGKENTVFRNNYFLNHPLFHELTVVKGNLIMEGDHSVVQISGSDITIRGRSAINEQDIKAYIERTLASPAAQAVKEKALTYLAELVYKDAKLRNCMDTFLANKQLTLQGQICDDNGVCETVMLGKANSNSAWPLPGAGAAELPACFFANADGNSNSLAPSNTSFSALQQQESGIADSASTASLAVVSVYLFF